MTLAVFTVGELITSAYRLCGLKNPHQSLSTPEMSHGKLLLKGIVRGLHTEGHFARVVSTELVTFEADENVYTMPSDVLDVVGVAKFVAATDAEEAGRSNNETVITMMSRDEWQISGLRGTSGQPTRYFPDRTDDAVAVYVTPTPSAAEDGSFGRFQVHRLRGDVSNENDPLDFEPYWVETLKYMLAEQLADAAVLNPVRAARFERKGQMLLDKAKGQSKQRKPQRFVVRHRTPWSR